MTPERWPARTPNYKEAYIPGIWYGDVDNGSTKTFMIENLSTSPTHQRLFELAFGKRPEWELYDNIMDPDQLLNAAEDPACLPTMKCSSGCQTNSRLNWMPVKLRGQEVRGRPSTPIRITEVAQ